MTVYDIEEYAASPTHNYLLSPPLKLMVCKSVLSLTHVDEMLRFNDA